MTKILWHSNGLHAPTGYGNQTSLFTPLIKAHEDYDVSISAFYGREGAPARDGHTDILELPRFRDQYGNDIVPGHVGYTKADVVVSLIDPFVLNPMAWGQLNWAAWAPIDCAPVSQENADSLEHATRIWAMSKFGEQALRDAGFDNVDYVPHGVDTETFKPIDRAFARTELERFTGATIGDKFLIVTVAANKGQPSRKNFRGMMAAFAQFHASHPESVWYIHTESRGYSGENLHEMAESFGITDAVIFPRTYEYTMNLIEPTFLNKIYNAGDVFFLLSMGEGFGIPIVEAQAAGCPVIVTDGSAMAELCLSGQRVRSQRWYAWGARTSGFWALADTDDAIDKLKIMHLHRDNTEFREQAREQALIYDYKRVFEQYMLPALAKMVPIGDGDFVWRDVTVGDVALKIRENHTGGTARDAAVEAISEYALDQVVLDDGDVVIDAGANVGVVSLYLAKKFPEAKIIAIEPHPETYDHLCHNIEANGLKNVIAGLGAIAGERGTSYLGGNVRDNAGGVHIYGHQGIEVDVNTLAYVMEMHKIDRVKLLKLDIEGAEWGVLRSAPLERVDMIRGELHTNAQLPHDEALIERVREMVPDTLFSQRVIADFPQSTDEAIDKQVSSAPDVSVIIPTLNGEATIERAVQSVVAQSGVRVECIVVDDGSTDDTAKVLESIDPRMFSHHNSLGLGLNKENLGQVPAMNEALENARGRWVLFIGDDDWLEPDSLRKLVATGDDAPDSVGFVYGDLQYHGKRTDRVKAKPYRRIDYTRHFPAGTGCIWRRSLMDKHNIKYRTLHDGKTAHAEDFDLILQIIKAGYTGQAVRGALVVHYTLAEGRATAWLHANQDNGLLDKWRERHPEFVGRL